MISWRLSYRCSNKASPLSLNRQPSNWTHVRNGGYSIPLLSHYSYWLFLFTCCDHGSTTASLMPAPYIPDIWLETCGRYYLYEIGFLMVAGCLCMAGFQWKLNLWIWCSGVWLMNCFGRNQCHWGWVDLWDDKDLLGSEIPDHLDHGRSIHLIYHDPSDLRPLILIQIVSKSPLLIIYMPWEISKHRTGQPINQ